MKNILKHLQFFRHGLRYRFRTHLKITFEQIHLSHVSHQMQRLPTLDREQFQTMVFELEIYHGSHERLSL